MSRDEAQIPYPARIIGWVLAIGALAAFILIVEKIALIRDPGYTPTCSINPLLSCGSLLYCVNREIIPVPEAVRPAVRVATTFHAAVPAVWLLAITAVIGVHFWDFWRTQI